MVYSGWRHVQRASVHISPTNRTSLFYGPSQGGLLIHILCSPSSNFCLILLKRFQSSLVSQTVRSSHKETVAIIFSSTASARRILSWTSGRRDSGLAITLSCSVVVEKFGMTHSLNSLSMICSCIFSVIFCANFGKLRLFFVEPLMGTSRNFFPSCSTNRERSSSEFFRMYILSWVRIASQISSGRRTR